MPKILVVDDDRDATRAAEVILKKGGFEVVILNYPKDVFKVVKTEKPDLIISDIIMPRWDGYALCKEIKELYRNKIPVILCTAKSYEQELIEKAHKEFGADDFIFKPFKEDVLVQKVEAVLEKQTENASD
ncbi:MAG: response regulator [Candidatus Omnitrophota bacterium]